MRSTGDQPAGLLNAAVRIMTWKTPAEPVKKPCQDQASRLDVILDLIRF
ncbi:MAG: hypothetical protein M0Z30_06865 [Actinomycetota bacterium]|nr:hypothetical protein [Actinomycetota bacterium]